MLTVHKRRLKKQYVIGGSGILDSILKFFARTFTSQGAKAVGKEIGKTALDAGKSVAVKAGKKLVDKVMNHSKRVTNIVNKYTEKGSAVDMQDFVKRLNGSGLKHNYN